MVGQVMIGKKFWSHHLQSVSIGRCNNLNHCLHEELNSSTQLKIKCLNSQDRSHARKANAKYQLLPWAYRDWFKKKKRYISYTENERAGQRGVLLLNIKFLFASYNIRNNLLKKGICKQKYHYKQGLFIYSCYQLLTQGFYYIS